MQLLFPAARSKSSRSNPTCFSQWCLTADISCFGLRELSNELSKQPGIYELGFLVPAPWRNAGTYLVVYVGHSGNLRKVGGKQCNICAHPPPQSLIFRGAAAAADSASKHTTVKRDNTP